MKKIVVILSILAISSTCFAFSDINLPAGQAGISEGRRSVAIFMLPEPGAVMSSALAIDYGLNKDLGLELTYLGIGKWYLASSNYQLGLHGKFDLGNFLGLNYLGLVGLGLTRADQSGTGVPVDLGIVPYRFINDRLYFSCPGVASVYSNGVLVNFLPGLTFRMPKSEIVLGYKGIASITSTGGALRGFWAVGVRVGW